MTDHTEGRDSASSTPTSAKVGNVFASLIQLAITAVRIIGAVFALILVIYIVLFVFDANESNSITQFFQDVSGGLTLGFAGEVPGQGGLFTPDNAKFAVLVNYGLAAIFWLVAAAIVARILQAVSTRAR